MSKVGSAEIEIVADDTKATSRVKRFFNTLKEGTKLGAAFATGVAVFDAIVQTFDKLGNATIMANARMEQSNIAWNTLLGSAEAASKMIKELQVFGAKTPFEFEGLDKTAKMLKAMGFEGKEIIPTLTSIGDAVSAVGGSQDMMEGVALAIGQIKTKGKLSAEEMNQLAERGIPAWELIAKQIGISKAELMDMTSSGKVLADEAIPALLKGMSEDFGGAMQKQSSTFIGMISNMKDSIGLLGQVLSKPIFDVFSVGLGKVLPVVEGFAHFLRGDVKVATETLNEGFNDGKAQKIIGFFNKIRDGGEIAKQVFLSIGEVSRAAFKIFMGDGAEGVSILQKIGLSNDQIALVIQAVNTLKVAFVTLASIATTAVSGVKNAAISVFSFLTPYIMPILTNVVSFISEKVNMISQFWQQNGQQISQAVSNVFNFILSVIQFVMPAVLFIVNFVWESVKGVINGALNVIIGLIKIFSGLFTGDWSKLWGGVKQILGGAVQLIFNLMNLTFLGGIKTIFLNLAKSGVTIIRNMGTGIVNLFKGLYTGSVNIANGMVTGVVYFFTNLFSRSVQIFGTLRTFGASIFEALKQTVINIAQNILSGVINKFISMATGTKNVFQGIWNSAKTIFNNVKNAITNPIETAKNTVTKAIEKIKSAFKNMKVKIPMPHFNASVSKKDIGGVSIPVPKMSVDWYAKGALFTEPTIFNTPFGLKGFGEAGPELAMPLTSKVLGMVGAGIARFMPVLQRMPELMVNIQPQPIFLDGRKIAEVTYEHTKNIKRIDDSRDETFGR